MLRVPVLSKSGKPLMPTKPSRARRWLKEGKAKVVHNDLECFVIQLTFETEENTQPIAVGIDPGKSYSGIGVQSNQVTLWMAHLVLPFKTVKERMELRRVMRRARRGRRINRKLPYHERCHRPGRFDNRKQKKLPPSIRANKQLELRVVKELFKLFPISAIHYELVMADVDRTRGRKSARSGVGFSPVMVGQQQMLTWLSELAPVTTHQGWERNCNGTSQLRQWLGLAKDKKNKDQQTPATHAVDGVTLAAFEFTQWREWYSNNAKHGRWCGDVQITSAPFAIIRRPPISRRQLHLCVPSKGGKRRKYGGTVTRHGFRKGDKVIAEKAGKTYIGWCSGDTKKQVSVSDVNWKRLGQFTAKKVQLLQRSTGLIVVPSTGLSNLPLPLRVDLTAIPLRVASRSPGVSREYDEFF
ncbi:RRXRR domain-containing protein [Coleofasciculus sp. E2-BRE-01]|uniref:RRXRR domain-containing protein n=1 Tax=Coleofasciculus sp. E2-BRE-01 TaxID=3069524 RepID=UPI0032F92D28